ncbi:ankyrin-1-like [Trichogramma pretiosum]|uniref:ankyrin-1-like n=1 Tax=Trichogramma pretiosum TaxID=7493 RepID=UPI000C719B4E|nr:ankyrin-1-like [Trichogramma pretiosum]
MSENESSVSYNNKKQLEVYGYLSKDVTWEIQEDRREFLYQLDTVVKNWKGQLPNLLDFFQKEAIFWLLIESVIDTDEHDIETPGKRFIDFVARSGYKDDPYADKDGEPLLRRTTPVHHAAKHVTNYVIISDLFKIYDKFDVAYIDEDGLTHFQVACLYGLDTVVEKFLELGQDPNGLSRGTAARYPPLYLALLNGHGTVAESLLRRGADLLRASADGVTPVHMLGKRNHNDAFLETFFEIVEEKYLTLQVNAIDHDGLLPLHYALRGRNKKLMELLLRHGANPNLCNEHGDTAVHFVCDDDDDDDDDEDDGEDDGEYKFLEKFFAINDELGNTIQVNVKNVQGDTPLILAMKSGNTNAVEQLLRRGADPHLVNDDGETCLHIICKSDWNDENMAKMLFEVCDEKHQTVQVDARDNEGWTPLLAAIYQGNINLVECLLRRGASPHLADYNELTPLHAICERKNSDDGLAKRFFEITDELNQPVEIDAKNDEGSTPLHLALSHGCKKLNELLLRRQADPNSAAENGFTPLHVVCLREDDDVDLVKMLFEMGDKFNKPIQIDARDSEDNTPLHFALDCGHEQIAKWLLRRGADLNLANARGWTPLHFISAQKKDYADLLQTFLEISDEQTRPIQIDARDSDDNTPLHFALNGGHEQKAEWLLRRGADINLANAWGSTPLHSISAGNKDHADLLGTFFEISDELNRTVEVDARNKRGETPLHHAIRHGHKKVFELLLRRDANPNLADNDGWTALHTICIVADDSGWAKMLFEISEENNRQVQIDVQCTHNCTPLHLALIKVELREVAELLLRKGAATNLVDWKGSTPLHTVCRSDDDDQDLARMLIDISNEENNPVEVDARDKLGRTPLHLALAERNCRVVEYLLKLGADPNLTDKNGFSPLHVISKDLYDDAELLELFFDASKEADRPVRVDVQDKKGRTPLQLAVANLSLDKVDVLLDRGADLSNFVFSSKSFFVERFRWVRAMDEKLSLASKIVAVVERLEKRGYELDRSDALNIMSLFAEYGLFEKSVDLDEYWYDDEEFVSKSKEIMVIPSLSLHDLIRLRPEEAAKQLKHENYIELARSNKLSDLPEGHTELCVRHLCEKLSRGFFWPWALDAFYELKHCQLPVLCCEMIIAELKNEDLYNICLACILA